MCVILYGERNAVIVVSRPRGMAHSDDECFWASRGDRITPQSRDDIIKRYIIIIINYYCHVRVSRQALRSARGARKIQNLRYNIVLISARVSIFIAPPPSIIITMYYILCT